MTRTRSCTVAFALVCAVLLAGACELRAQCFTGQTAFYQPAAQPAPAQTFEVATGWFPGKLLGQFTARLFGANTRMVGRPVAPVAFAPVTTAAFRPAATTAGFQPNACCNPCATSFSAASPVMSSGCSTCGANFAAPATTFAPAPATTTEPQPRLAPDYQIDSQYNTNRPVLEAEPQSGSAADRPAGGASYFEAPRLYDPRDGRAQHATASVWTAQYYQSAGTSEPRATRAVHLTSARPVYEAPQSEYNSAGWTAASD